jgi:YfiH family protein
MSTLIYDSVKVGPIDVVALSRNGGLSQGVFSSLNLANYVGDNPSQVAQNIELAGRCVGTTEICVMQGEHGARINVVASSGYAPRGDGLVSTTPGLAIVALAADCVPFALVDPINLVVAVGHAGWKGVSVNVMQNLVMQFVASGGEIAHSTAVLGPAICGSCYEVPAIRTAELHPISPISVIDDRHIDVGAGVRFALAETGLKTIDLPGCTLEDENLFSYRRANGEPTGRGGLIVSLPSS